ncbi:MAG: sortase [Candidatus Levybacteria bacterium]|nr:sortase [Candidatus Levybacteria bacterium]
MVKRKAKTSRKPRRARGKKIVKNKKSVKSFIVGVVFFALSVYLLFNFPQLKAPANNNPIKIDSRLITSEHKNHPPVRILIPNEKIDLPVVEAKLVAGFWEVSENSASHGVGSANPGEKGNIVIFAHARQGLFYNLKDVKEGETVYLFTKDNWRKYKISKITSVYPNQTETIAPTKEETLTIYTCTGFYDEKRLIVKALPKN